MDIDHQRHGVFAQRTAVLAKNTMGRTFISNREGRKFGRKDGLYRTSYRMTTP